MGQVQVFISVVISSIFGVSILRWRGQPFRVLVLLVLYCSMYYLYTVPAIISGAGVDQVAWLTSQSRNKVAMGGAFGVLMVTLWVSFFYWRRWPVNFRREYEVQIFVVAVLMATGYVFNFARGGGFILEDISSISGVIFVVVLIPLVGGVNEKDFHGDLKLFMPFVATFFISVVAFGFYEVASQKAWSAYPATNGLWIFRASSIFFTPGWFGPWLALLWIAQMYVLRTRLFPLRVSVLGLAISGAGVFIAGSRATLLVIFVLAFTLYLVTDKRERKYIAIGIGVFFLAFLMTVFASLMMFDQSSRVGIFYPLGALADRWASLPVELINYGMIKLSKYIPWIVSPLSSVSPEFIAVIEDRLSGARRDSAFLTVLDHGGIVSFGGVVSLILFVGYKVGCHVGSQASSISKSFSVLLFIIFIASGIHGRVLQAFPVWLVAGSLVIAISLWLAIQNVETS